MKTIGAKIKSIRMKCGFSQEDMAHELGITPHHYSKIERNLVDLPISRLEQIVTCFKMTIADFFNFEEPDKEKESLKSELAKYKKSIEIKDSEIMTLQKKLISALEKNKKQ